jgi:pyrimidine operon attenuation protein / uracil phosphoribosyltransferase
VSKTDIWKDTAAIEAAIDTMAKRLRERLERRGIEAPLMIGIHTGGVWVAERLHARLAAGRTPGPSRHLLLS